MLHRYSEAQQEFALDPGAVAFLCAVPGELAEEFAGLQAILDRASFAIERADVEAVVRRFQSCADIGATAWTRLRLHVRPPEPGA